MSHWRLKEKTVFSTCRRRHISAMKLLVSRPIRTPYPISVSSVHTRNELLKGAIKLHCWYPCALRQSQGKCSVIPRPISMVIVQWSPLVRSTFCPKKFDHTSGLTIHPGCNQRRQASCDLRLPSRVCHPLGGVAAGVENTEAEVGLNSRRHP